LKLRRDCCLIFCVNQEAIDTALRQVIPFLEGCADQLLDFRDSAVKAQNPGKCIRCYFTIYRKAAASAEARLLPLKRWLERHIEIVAKDEADNELESLPVVLREERLEDYCERIMAEFRENRVYESARIGLAFRFRETAREKQAA